LTPLGQKLSRGDVFSGWVIEAELGQGGMGIVYRAWDPRLDRQIALKLIASEYAEDEEYRRRFVNEARLAAAIDHPNLVPIHAAGEVDEVLYLVMRYVEGTDLRAVLSAQGALPPRRAAAIVSQVAAALDAAHAKGLVHRDVKPGNVLLSSEGGDDHAYLADFGLAKRVDAAGGPTSTGHFVGTVDYVAPEQVQGGRVDARSDVYSLGCVLYHALTGSVPFPREEHFARLFAHLHDPPPVVSALRPELAGFDRIVGRAMAKDPSDRFPSAGDLGRAASGAAHAEPVAEPESSVAVGPAAPAAEDPHPLAANRGPTGRPPREPAPVDSPGRSRWRRKGLVFTAALGAALVAGAATATILSSGGPSKHATAVSSAPTTPLSTSPQQGPNVRTTPAQPLASVPASLDALTPSAGTAPDKKGAATVNGRPFSDALTYASSDTPISTSWPLRGKYRRFSAVVAIGDCQQGCADSTTMFDVAVDGRTIISRRVDDRQNVSVSHVVVGGQVLTLTMSFVKNFPGVVTWWWGDPKVSP
jgi:serine/threonine protein kinase